MLRSWDTDLLIRQVLYRLPSESDHSEAFGKTIFLCTYGRGKRRISKLDIDEYAAKAKRYVEQAAKDRAANHGKTDRTAAYFSEQANAEMRLYNATMKINRLELLKAHLGLEMIEGHDELEKLFGDALSQKTMDVFKRQAGILGNTILNNEKLADSIVNASFHNAEFSDRVWMAQDLMKYRLHEIPTQALIKGLNPKALTRELMPLIKKEILENKRAAAERLLSTELCRVQTEAQMKSFERNGFDKYIFLAEPTACPHCRKLDNKVFDVKDAMPGENAPPLHPIVDVRHQVTLKAMKNMKSGFTKLPGNIVHSGRQTIRLRKMILSVAKKIIAKD